jgi:hypothetical protein
MTELHPMFIQGNALDLHTSARLTTIIIHIQIAYGGIFGCKLTTLHIFGAYKTL